MENKDDEDTFKDKYEFERKAKYYILAINCIIALGLGILSGKLVQNSKKEIKKLEQKLEQAEHIYIEEVKSPKGDFEALVVGNNLNRRVLYKEKGEYAADSSNNMFSIDTYKDIKEIYGDEIANRYLRAFAK